MQGGQVAQALVEFLPAAIITGALGTQEVHVDGLGLALAVGPVLRLSHQGHLVGQLHKHHDAGRTEVQA